MPNSTTRISLEQRTLNVSDEIGEIEFAEYVDADEAVIDSTAGTGPTMTASCSVSEEIRADEAARPAWLRAKTTRESEPPVRLPRIKPIPKRRFESETPEEKFRRWWNSPDRGACLASIAGHVVLLVLLSLVVLGQQRHSSEPFTTIVSEADVGPAEFTGMIELSEAAPGGSKGLDALLADLNGAALRPAFAPELIGNVGDLALGNSGAGAHGNGQGKGVGDGQGDGFADGEGFLFKMPKGGGAIQRGSFAAWSVPKDPQPRENYMIVIRIKLPPGTKQYRVSDLTGTIIGTDGFALQIPYDRRRDTATVTERSGKVVPVKLSDFLPIVDNQVQVMINVPGASDLVRDTIELKSKLLKENQKLEIVF